MEVLVMREKDYKLGKGIASPPPLKPFTIVSKK
jgi:hypothetical protein